MQNIELGTTFEDLQNNFENFRNLTQYIASGSSPMLKLFAFAFIRIYLSNYITIAKP
jgi:hypothetical protein